MIKMHNTAVKIQVSFIQTRFFEEPLMAAPALSDKDLSWHSLTHRNVNITCFASIIASAARTNFFVDKVSSSHPGQITGIREIAY